MRWVSMACCPRLRSVFFDLEDAFFDFAVECVPDEGFFEVDVFFAVAADIASADKNIATNNTEDVNLIRTIRLLETPHL